MFEKGKKKKNKLSSLPPSMEDKMNDSFVLMWPGNKTGLKFS